VEWAAAVVADLAALIPAVVVEAADSAVSAAETRVGAGHRVAGSKMIEVAWKTC
jgi:hypothetical protein